MLSFLSTEDWVIPVAASFDLSGYGELRAELRELPFTRVIDDCSLENGRISVTETGATVTSFAADRSWQAFASRTITCDVMGYDTSVTPVATKLIQRTVFAVEPGVTYGPLASTDVPPAQAADAVSIAEPVYSLIFG